MDLFRSEARSEVRALLVQHELEADLIQARVLLRAMIKVNAVELEGLTGMTIITLLCLLNDFLR